MSNKRVREPRGETPENHTEVRVSKRGILSYRKRFQSRFEKVNSHTKFINLSFIITNIKDKMTNLCGNRLLQNNFINIFGEIKSGGRENLQHGPPAESTFI